ncbi:hypothetical protein AV530_000037 [Patagioenas fasciata monilis]|uniref:Uncharacterized protein n=1 Tax=Patagioenas fasciata monilis TaxID=372326 RepID=A0A1V4K021_PATFA|nr:hypothetical protein AV530_000037 [Patagioenas fasciata monilis]
MKFFRVRPHERERASPAKRSLQAEMRKALAASREPSPLQGWMLHQTTSFPALKVSSDLDADNCSSAWMEDFV